jgi:hypothetical protein
VSTPSGVHDRGGQPTDEPIDRREHAPADWELLVDALLQVLSAKGVMTVDELRRGIEQMDPGRYEAAAYYERWITSIERILVEKGVLAPVEIDRRAAELAG